MLLKIFITTSPCKNIAKHLAHSTFSPKCLGEMWQHGSPHKQLHPWSYKVC